MAELTRYRPAPVPGAYDPYAEYFEEREAEADWLSKTNREQESGRTHENPSMYADERLRLYDDSGYFDSGFEPSPEFNERLDMLSSAEERARNPHSGVAPQLRSPTLDYDKGADPNNSGESNRGGGVLAAHASTPPSAPPPSSRGFVPPPPRSRPDRGEPSRFTPPPPRPRPARGATAAATPANREEQAAVATVEENPQAALSMIGQMLEGLSTPAVSAEQTAEQKQSRRSMALLIGGLATMAEASRPGATALGALGAGGLAGVGQLQQMTAQDKAANAAKEKTRGDTIKELRSLAKDERDFGLEEDKHLEKVAEQQGDTGRNR